MVEKVGKYSKKGIFAPEERALCLNFECPSRKFENGDAGKGEDLKPLRVDFFCLQSFQQSIRMEIRSAEARNYISGPHIFSDAPRHSPFLLANKIVIFRAANFGTPSAFPF